MLLDSQPGLAHSRVSPDCSDSAVDSLGKTRREGTRCASRTNYENCEDGLSSGILQQCTVRNPERHQDNKGSDHRFASSRPRTGRGSKPHRRRHQDGKEKRSDYPVSLGKVTQSVPDCRKIPSGRFRDTVSQPLLVSDIRYVVFDQKQVLIGLPVATGENEPTREGYLIPSEGLAQIFLQEFESKWLQGTDYEEYLKEVILEMRQGNPNASSSLVSSQLGIPESEVLRVTLLCEIDGEQVVSANSLSK